MNQQDLAMGQMPCYNDCLMFGLKFPLAFPGSSPKWNFWSSAHPGAGLGAPEVECEALPPVCQGLAATGRLGYRLAGCTGQCLARARHKQLLPPHNHDIFLSQQSPLVSDNHPVAQDTDRDHSKDTFPLMAISSKAKIKEDEGIQELM